MKRFKVDAEMLAAWSLGDIIDAQRRLARLVLDQHWTRDTAPRWVLDAWETLRTEEDRRARQLALFDDYGVST